MTSRMPACTASRSGPVLDFVVMLVSFFYFSSSFIIPPFVAHSLFLVPFIAAYVVEDCAAKLRTEQAGLASSVCAKLFEKKAFF